MPKKLAKKLPGGGKDMSSNDLWAFFKAVERIICTSCSHFRPLGMHSGPGFESFLACELHDNRLVLQLANRRPRAVAVRFLKDIKRDNVRQALNTVDIFTPARGLAESIAGRKRVTYTTPPLT